MPPQAAPKRQPTPGDVLRLDRTKEPIRVVEVVGEGGQGVVFQVTLSSGAPLALKWYRSTIDTPHRRNTIRALVHKRQPHTAFLFPFDMVTDPGVAGFGYVMPWMESRFITVAQAVSEQSLSLPTMARIGRKLAEAFHALHSSGLCYRDISFGNLWVDPVRADLAIIDNDNVGADGGDSDIWGSLKFMAPEVTRREARPSTLTDMHSLAVLLFILLMHGHPLEGVRVEESYGWGPHRASEQEISMLHFGKEPLFIFDPHDPANRVVPTHPPAVRWPFYPQFIRDLFTRAFTVGLREPSLASRILPARWRDAMASVHDLASLCANCGVALIHDPEDPAKPCWYCGVIPPQRPLLRLRQGREIVLLAEGAVLSNHHVTGDRDYDGLAAVVEAHPRAPYGLLLRNRTTSTWRVHPAGETAKEVVPEDAFAIRNARITFGRTHGEITVPTIR